MVPNTVIIESKSMSKDCFSHQVMQKHGLIKADACSKYCLGLYYLDNVKEWTKFQPTIDRIETIKNTKDWAQTPATQKNTTNETPVMVPGLHQAYGV